jgi:hypothetical protein
VALGHKHWSDADGRQRGYEDALTDVLSAIESGGLHAGLLWIGDNVTEPTADDRARDLMARVDRHRPGNPDVRDLLKKEN